MYENIKIPENIDEYITKGLKRGRTKKTYTRVKRLTGIFICALLSIFIVGIRVSPVFASSVAKIPGLNYVVELVRQDKGLTAAIENEYIQHIGKSVESEGILFTVKDIISDDSGIIVFYSLENKKGYIRPHIRSVKLTDPHGKELKLSGSHGYTPGKESIYEDKIEFYTNENQAAFPDRVVLKIQIECDGENQDSTPIEGTWEIPFTIDKTKLSGTGKMHSIDQTIEVEEQRIRFESLRIFPIKSILTVSMDKSNTKKLFAFDDLKLVDEKGEEWGRIINGFSGSNPGEDTQTLNFQSNYFTRPKELYIIGSSIRALDKDKCYFTLDTGKREIISPYNLLSLKELMINRDNIKLNIDITKPIEDVHNSYEISGEVTDGEGKKLEIAQQGMGSSDTTSFMTYNILKGADFKEPLIFKICDYPSRIKGNFKIKIPLE